MDFNVAERIPEICHPFYSGSTILTPDRLPSVFGPANTLTESWLNFAAVALLASTAMIVMVYFASQFFRSGKMEAWVKFELFQAVATAVMTLFVVFVVFSMCTFDASILDKARYQSAQYMSQGGCNYVVPDTGQRVVPPYCIAQSYLSEIRLRGQDIFQFLMLLNYGFNYMFKMTYESRPMGIGYTAEPLQGFQQIQNLFMLGISGFMVAFLTTLIQQRILDFLLLAMPFFFFPIGIVLRSFAPTREFGGAVMGMVIASILFYPLTLVMNDVLVFSDMADLTTGRQVPSYFNQMTSKTNPNTWSVDTTTGGLIDMYEGGAQAEQMPSEINSPYPNAGLPASENQIDTSFFLLSPCPMVMIFFVAAVMLPIINFIVYVESARQLSSLLGSEVDLTNLTRMI